MGGKARKVTPGDHWSVVFSFLNYTGIRFLGIENRDDDTKVEDPDTWGFPCCFAKKAALLLELRPQQSLG